MEIKKELIVQYVHTYVFKPYQKCRGKKVKKDGGIYFNCCLITV